jgi:hypothetical protein
MSTPINDGGPAFPYAFSFPDDPGSPGGINLGMTLRDWFAGQALHGWLASFSPDAVHPVKNDVAADVAHASYAMADAMLAARAARKGEDVH